MSTASTAAAVPGRKNSDACIYFPNHRILCGDDIYRGSRYRSCRDAVSSRCCTPTTRCRQPRFRCRAVEPGIVVIVNDDNSITIYRLGLENVSESGAYSLAVTFIGFDVTIDERLVYGRQGGLAATAAQATVTGFAPERYHFLYRSETPGANAAFNLHIRPGNRIDRRLE